MKTIIERVQIAIKQVENGESVSRLPKGAPKKLKQTVVAYNKLIQSGANINLPITSIIIQHLTVYGELAEIYQKLEKAQKRMR